MSTPIEAIEIRFNRDTGDCETDFGVLQSVPAGPVDPDALGDVTSFATFFAEQLVEAGAVEWRGATYTFAGNGVVTVTGQGHCADYEILPARWWDSPPGAVDIYLGRRRTNPQRGQHHDG